MEDEIIHTKRHTQLRDMRRQGYRIEGYRELVNCSGQYDNPTWDRVILAIKLAGKTNTPLKPSTPDDFNT